MDFSIIVPSFGRPERLADCLRALGQLEVPRHRFEVIVVDDGSIPPLAPDPGPLLFSLLRQPNAGPAAARNAGASRARGAYLAFTDDDCTPAPDWLSQLAGALQKEPEAMVGGTTINGLPDNVFSAASQSLVSYLYDYYNRDHAGARFFTSNNIAMPLERFRELGGFEPGFRRAAGEDRWLCAEWRRRGWPMRYVPSARVIHRHRLGLRSFWRQHLAYGRAACRFHRLAARVAGAFRVEPWAFYRGLLTYPWKANEARPLRQGALLLGSQLANAVGFFLEAIRSGRSQRGERISRL